MRSGVLGYAPATAAALMFAAAPAALALPAFPGAEGFGGRFSGTAPSAGWFSNATVYHVTNLNDSGPGSFRNAFVENSSNKIVVFDVAGTIQLTTDNIDIKNLSNYYIAGQTAPGPVTIYGDMVQLTHSSGKENRNVALRYLSFRKGTADNQDSITFAGSGLGTNLILDHVSASWSEDEILSVANNNTNVTVQYSLIHDALVNNHAYGSLIRPRINSSVTFHHNLYANNASRQARFGTYDGLLLTADFRNNVVYNWRDRASYAGGSSEAEQEFVDVNFVGNYFIAGPGTGSNTTQTFIVDKNVDVRAYQSGNYVDSDKQLNPGGVPNGTDTGWGMFAFNPPVIDQTLIQLASPLATPNVITQSATDAYWQVANHVGNFWWDRDAIDSRVINNLLTNTAPAIGGAAPLPGELNGLLSSPTISRPAGWDTDSDGMPDAWELAHGLNPNLPADFALDFDLDGYINLLDYVNEAGAFPAPALAVWTNSEGNGRYARNDNWSTWQPSRFDVVKIDAGTVTVDAAGQHAGELHVGQTGSATLALDSGWLKVHRLARVHEGGAIAFNGGKLDLAGGYAIVDYSAGNSPLTTLTTQLANGSIFGSLAATIPGMAVGIAEASVLGFTQFAGEPVDSTTVLLRLAWQGDTNFDGVVDITDLGNLATNWQSTGTWTGGDFNHDGIIDITDLGLLATNWQAGAGAALGLSFDQALTSLGMPSGVVPEPAGAVVVLALPPLMARRRRFRRKGDRSHRADR